MAAKYCIYSYRLLCIIAAIGMFLYGVSKYAQNRDVSMVDFMEITGEDGNVYPAVSICLATPYLERQLDNGKNADYWRFLSGQYWEDSLLDISYENITQAIQNFFLGASAWNFWSYKEGWVQYIYLNRKLENRTDIQNYTIKGFKWFTPKFYTSFRHLHEKCMTIEIPNSLNHKISTFELFFNDSIFRGIGRPRQNDFGIKIHYPNQLLTSTFSNYIWEKHDGQEDYTMKFVLQNLIVLNRRNKRNSPCIEDWKNHDQIIRRKIMEEAVCQPPHWDRITDLPRCSSQKQMKHFHEMNISARLPPCRQIKKVVHGFEELKYVDDNPLEWARASNDTIFKIMIEFKDLSFMEIRNVRSFDIESLIGNAGGYIGLFTGYALLQLPNLMLLVLKWIYKARERFRMKHEENRDMILEA